VGYGAIAAETRVDALMAPKPTRLSCRDTARSRVDVTHLLRFIPARLAAENLGPVQGRLGPNHELPLSRVSLTDVE
jgi:hypothetical protein